MTPTKVFFWTVHSSVGVRRSIVFHSTVNHRNGSVPRPLSASVTAVVPDCTTDHVSTGVATGDVGEVHAASETAVMIAMLVKIVLFMVSRID